MSTTEDQVRENRLRRMAKRHGFTLGKSRRRDPDEGSYSLRRQSDNSPVWRKKDLDEVEEILTDKGLMKLHGQ